jgi:ankyrin repeat protein
MHISAGNGNLGNVKLLFERGADVHALNDEGETPYQVSLASGYREIVDFLREQGAGGVQ